MKPILVVFALALSAWLPAHAVQAQPAANLLTNGSFELPGGTSYVSLLGNNATITGWKTVLNGVEWFNAVSIGGAADGVMVVDLANYTYTGGGIEQTFATQAGSTYELSFSLGTMQAYGRTGTAHIDVTVADISVGYDVVNPTASMVWTPVSLIFTAAADTTTLRFANNQNPYLHFANVDAVSVTTAVPEPEAWALLLVGLGLVGFVARRKSV